MELGAGTKPCVLLISRIKHPPTEPREEKSIPTQAASAQAAAGIFNREEETREEENDEAHLKGHPSSLLILDSSGLPPLHRADVLSPLDLPLLNLVVLS